MRGGRSTGLYRFEREPDLSSTGPAGRFGGPPLVMVMEGWVDAGLGSSTALGALLAALPTETIATFDTDRLLDHRARRPVLRIVDGVNAGLSWPTIELRAGRAPGSPEGAAPAGAAPAGRPLLLLLGPEPDHEWRAFADSVYGLATRFGAGILVGLGAFPAPVPHTRRSGLVATASTQELAAEVGFLPGTLDVPAGINAALGRRFSEGGVPAVSLWARVPHYAAAMPYPEAGALLLDGLGRLIGIEIDTTELHQAAAAHRRRLDELIANSEEHQSLVRQLEAQTDSPGGAGGLAGDVSSGNLPSGDELAAELERYLREEREEG
ncbi:MAG: proteasome assembly chaperone family protein [Acidimicrobiales bacterium]